MLTTVEGVYRNGCVEILEKLNDELEGARVIVTFIRPSAIDLPAQGIDQAEAEDLRAKLTTFSDDWNSPEMSIYDDYDAATATR